MESINQSINQQPTSTQLPLANSGQLRTNYSRTWMIIVAAGIVAIGFTLWYAWYLKKHQVRTPEQVLVDLEHSSMPVTATPIERKVELDALTKSSTSVTKTDQERLQELEALE